MYYAWKKLHIRKLILLLHPAPQQILNFNFRQPALPHTAKNPNKQQKKIQLQAAGLKISQLCVLQFPALLALPTFSVACQLTNYNKRIVLVSLRKDNIFSLLILKKHFSFLKLKLTFDSKQLLCLTSGRRKILGRIPPFPSQTIDSEGYRDTKNYLRMKVWEAERGRSDSFLP